MDINVDELKMQIAESKLHDKEHQLKYCDILLRHALETKIDEDIAYAYLWMADYHYYVKRDMDGLDFYLKKAKEYLSMEPCKNMIQYYTLKAMNNDTTYDLLSRLDAYLKIIDNGNIIGDELSVVTANGNIAELFHLCRDHQTALTYGIAVYEQYRNLTNARDINKTILLTNIVEASCYIKDVDKALAYINELEEIQGTFSQYQMYLNICYLRYFATKKLVTDALRTKNILFEQIKQLDASRDTKYECLTIMIESMFTIHATQEVEELILHMETIIKETDVNRWLQIQKMWVDYFTMVDNKNALTKHYKIYVKAYVCVEQTNQETKIKGIRANIEIQNIMRKEETLLVDNRSLETQSMVDMMTGLYNRRYFNSILLQLNQDHTLQSLGFAIFDVDYFKEYNDIYGHIMGDQTLICIANMLKSTKDKRIIACRFGGDEFICIFTNMLDVEIKTYIENIMKQLKKAAIAHSGSLSSTQVTLSIGYGLKNICVGFDQEQLLEKVDQALYESKRMGKNTFTKSETIGDCHE